MLAFLSWYLLISLVGLLAFPLAFRLLPHLADRGWALARALGLLLWTYVFWLLASLQVLQNNAGGGIIALCTLAAVSGLALRGRWEQFRAWLRREKRQILTTELLFLAAFAAWALVRAMNPDVTGTEKPMEQAFINAILRSPGIPPNDPWLSGYAISYYYFGYVMVALLIRLTGVETGVGFNLAVALWFALSALGAYALLYSLLVRRFVQEKAEAAWPLARFWALLAPFFLLIVSNIEGFLEMLHARGIFWQQTASGWQSPFWKWIALQELVDPPSGELSWIPERVGGIWWWRASRVLQDFNLAGQSREVIDEFPFFSYLLADLHPHVLAMPFAFLCMALAWNFSLQQRERPLPELGLSQWTRQWTRDAKLTWWDSRLGAWMRTPGFWLAALALGGMAVINTWDFPIYVALFAAAYGLVRFQRDGWRFWARIGELVEIALGLAVTGILLYLPFYFGFSSQAGGFLPSLSFFTRGVHFWLMFATLLIPIVGWIAYVWRWRGTRRAAISGLKFAASVIFGLWALSFALAGLVLFVLGNTGRFVEIMQLFLGLHGADTGGYLLAGALAARLAQPGTWLSLLVILTLVWGLLSTYHRKPAAPIPSANGEAPPALTNPVSPVSSVNSFVLVLVLLGCGLVLAPEFFYLRDQFGGRMNTIFKFYFQTWLVWSLAAGYAVAVLFTALSSGWKWLVRIGILLLTLLGLAYPAFGVWYKTGKFDLANATLDGNAHLEAYQAEEMSAIRYLRRAPLGVVVEAIGGSYNASFARVSTLTGQPTILGWPGHESQWRGGDELFRDRAADVDTIYRSTSWPETLALLQKYHVRYVFVGQAERSTYRVSTGKFDANLKPVFQNETTIVYEVPELILSMPLEEVAP
jgi:YYY domain-containing protein